MVQLPITCSSCGRKRNHYGHCDCPDGRLWWIDQRRESIKRHLEQLDAEEREVLGLVENGPVECVAEKKLAFECATELVAAQLALFRDETSTPTANEELMAGHIVGNLWANDLLNTAGEKWISVNRRSE